MGGAGRHELHFAWSEGAFPGKEGNSGAVTLNKAVYKPEIGLASKEHQRQPRERRQGEPDRGAAALSARPRCPVPNCRGGEPREAQSQATLRGGAGLQPVALLRAPGGLRGSWLKQMAIEPSAEISFY